MRRVLVLNGIHRMNVDNGLDDIAKRDPIVAMAKALTTARIAKALVVLGSALALIAAFEWVGGRGGLRVSLLGACGAGWGALGAWVVLGDAGRWVDREARKRAPFLAFGATLVLGPLSNALHGHDGIASVLATLVAGPSMGLAVALSGNLLRESVESSDETKR